ncbi:MAG: radical SAM protein, partial [Thermoplasmatales archaeon]
MKDPKTLLSDYFEILNETRNAKYLDCKKVPVDFKTSDSIESLFKIHDNSLNKFRIEDKSPKKSLLDLKMELASRIFKSCSFCERRCNIDRTKKSGK